MLKVTFVAGVLFTATLVTSGAADAHDGRRHVPAASRAIDPSGHAHSAHHAHHGPGSAHGTASHRRRTRVATRCRPRHRASAHRLAARHARSRFETAARHGGVPAPVGIQTGRASYYESRHRTATGGSVGVATCAHRTLPFGTRVLVTNLANARAAVLTVNDRGPFVRGRIVDVSTAAAGILGMLHAGTAQVRVRVIGPG